MKKFYKEKFELHGRGIRSLGWGSKKSQEKRFSALQDIGCGFADFYFFLGDKNIDYCGLEKNLDFYKVSKNRITSDNFAIVNSDYRDLQNGELEYDWTVASGVFCFDRLSWYEDTIQQVDKLFSFSRKGTAVNFLSRLSPGDKIEGFMHADPFKLGSLISTEVTKKISLRHDYLKNDFTYYLYK